MVRDAVCWKGYIGLGNGTLNTIEVFTLDRAVHDPILGNNPEHEPPSRTKMTTHFVR